MKQLSRVPCSKRGLETTKVSHCPASKGKSMPGSWKEVSDCQIQTEQHMFHSGCGTVHQLFTLVKGGHGSVDLEKVYE